MLKGTGNLKDGRLENTSQRCQEGQGDDSIKQQQEHPNP